MPVDETPDHDAVTHDALTFDALTRDAVTRDLVTRDVVDMVTGRAAIDRVDAQIRDLVRQRQQLSTRVHEFRAGEGQPGVQHGRENDIVRAYAEELGRPGTRIALELLALCRG